MSPSRGTPTHSVRVPPDVWSAVGVKLAHLDHPVQVVFTLHPVYDGRRVTRSDAVREALTAIVEEDT